MFITSLCPHANGNASRRVPECHNLKCHDLKSHFRESHVPKSTRPPVHTSPSPHSKGDFCLICYPSTQTLFEHALPKILKNRDGVRKSEFYVDFALLLVGEFQENVGGFLLCPPFQNARKMLGVKARTFCRLPFSLLLARNCFPHCFSVPFVGWEKI